MKCENLLNKLLPYLILLFAFLALVGVDYSPALGDVYRGGRIRYLLLAFAVAQYLFLQGINPFWAAFSALSFGLWCIFDFSGFGAIDVALIPACLLVGELVRRLVKSSTVTWAVAHLALVQGAYGAFQFFGIDPFFNVEPAFKNVAMGTFGHHTILAPFLALGAATYLVRWQWVPAILLSAAVLLTGSTMGIASLLGAALYVLWRFQPKCGYIAAGAGLSALLVGFLAAPGAELYNWNGRLTVWPLALQGVIESPILGHGPGGFLENRERWGLTVNQIGMYWDQAHQEYLQVWIEQGLLGLAMVLAGLFATMRICQKLNPVYGAWVVVLAVNSLANFTMHIATYGLIAGWLAAVTWQKRRELCSK